MIEINNLRKVFNLPQGDVIALDNVNLHVRQGEIYGVLGQSGAGKSTLIRSVNMLERPTAGTVRVDRWQMTSLAGDELRQARQHIGMIFQHFNLLSRRTVAENIAFPLEVMGLNASKRASRVAELLDLVGLGDRARSYPAQLSGGQKQRVGIARALAGEPRVLLSDEATSALDPETTRSVLGLLKDLNRRLGLTILLITHEMGVVKAICDSVALMHAGRIVEQGALVDLVARPDSRLAREFFPHMDSKTPQAGGVLATIRFAGTSADQPVITTMARRFALDANILGGSVETVGNRRVGQLQVELLGDQVEDALQYLRAQGLHVELT